MASSKVSMKLYIDRKNSRVLFAKAGKEFIDFLFNFLAPPVETLLPHLNREVLSGMHKIYESIQNSSGAYLLPNVLKDTLLKPKVYVSGGSTDPLLQLPNIEFSTPWIIFGCYEMHTYMSKDYGLNCPMCKRPMYYSYKLIGPSSKPSSGEGGYVKRTITYMVSDNLAVELLTSIIGTLRNKFNVKDIGALDEKVVDLDMDVGLKLLKASLQSKSILTDFFLPMLKKGLKLLKASLQSKSILTDFFLPMLKKEVKMEK